MLNCYFKWRQLTSVLTIESKTTATFICFPWVSTPKRDKSSQLFSILHVPHRSCDKNQPITCTLSVFLDQLMKFCFSSCLKDRKHTRIIVFPLLSTNEFSTRAKYKGFFSDGNEFKSCNFLVFMKHAERRRNAFLDMTSTTPYCTV